MVHKQNLPVSGNGHAPARRCALALAAMAAIGAGAVPTFAINGNWTFNGNGDWSLATNWSSNPDVPDGEGSVVGLTKGYSSGTTRFVTIDTTSRTVGTLTIGDPGGFPRIVNLAASGGASLILNGAGTDNARIQKTVGSADIISAPMVLDSALDVSNGAANTLTITGPISGAYGIAFDGTTRVNMSGTVDNTTFTGGVTLKSGELAVINDKNVLGTGALTLQGGTFRSDRGSNLHTDSHNLNLNGSFSVASGTGGITFSGPATIGGNIAISANAGSVGSGRNTTFSNIAGGTGNLTLNATSGSGNSAGIGFRIGTANHTGSIANASTGTGWVIVTGVVGANVTGITQNSATSTTQLDGNNLFTGKTVTIEAGTLILNHAGAINSAGTNSLAFGTGTTPKLQMNGFGATVAGLTGTSTTAVIENGHASNASTLTVNNAGAGNFAGTIQNGAAGSLSIVKQGAGVLTLGGNNTYSGATTVSAGTLLVHGMTSGLGSVSVADDAVLGGGGTIGLATGQMITLADGASLTPGTSPGILSVSGSQTTTPTGADATLNLLAGTIFNVQIDGTTAGTGYDQVVLTGTIGVNGAVLNVGLPSIAIGTNQVFTIVQNDGSDAVYGIFASLPQGALVYTDTNTGNSLYISYTGEGGAISSTGNDVILYSTVPEPASIALLGLGVVGILRRRRH